MLSTVLNQLFILGFLCLTGLAAERFGILPVKTQKGITNLILEVTLPASFLAGANMSLDGDSSIAILQVAAIAAAYYGITLFLSVRAGRFIFKNSLKSKIAALSFTFANVAFIGFPVSFALFGEEGLFYASIFSIFYNLYLFTLGIRVINPGNKGEIWKILVTTRNTAIVLMIVLFLLQIKLPEPLQDVFEIMGNASTPLSMFVIGAMLSKSPFRELFADWRVYLVSLVRLVVIPVIMMLVFKLSGYSNLLVIRVMVVMASMPVGSMIAMIAEKYDCEPEYSTVTIVQSMVLFVVSFPAMMVLSEFLFAA